MTRFATAALSLMVYAGAGAQTVELPLIGDSFVNANAPDTAFGELAEPLYVHTWGPKATLLKFDASALVGASVASAAVRLNLTSIDASGTVTAYTINEDWDEATVTYNNQPLYLEDLLTSSVTLGPPDAGGLVSIDVTEMVRQWAEFDPDDRRGIRLDTDESIRAVFDSRDLGTAATLRVALGDGPGVGTPREVLDLSSAPITIDRPGHYALDRDWNIVFDGVYDGPIIEIAADDVVLDLNGHEVRYQHEGSGVYVGGANVEVRNGALLGGLSLSIRSEAADTLIQQLETSSFAGTSLSGARAIVRESNLFGDRQGLRISGADAVVERNTIACSLGSCVDLSGDRGFVLDNRILLGDASVRIQSSDNVLARNTIIGGVQAAIEVHGTRNILDGNVVIPDPGTQTPPITGISFTVGGNSYGDNRVAATVPFDLGGTTQTDWGGNVGY